MSCPFKFSKKVFSAFNRDDENNDTTLSTKADPFGDESKCPYSKTALKEEEDKANKDENKENENSDDEQPTGGCPMKNTGKY